MENMLLQIRDQNLASIVITFWEAFCYYWKFALAKNLYWGVTISKVGMIKFQSKDSLKLATYVL